MDKEKELNPTHVLLADDDDDDFEIFKVVLNDIPIATVLSRVINGEILMNFLKEVLPDILFLDIQMPCKDGRQCIKEIRSDSRYDNLPVIIYTSLLHKLEVDYFFREGANLFAVKPAFIKELKETVEKILSVNWKAQLFYPSRASFVVNKI